MYLLGSQEVADLFSRDKARPIFEWLEAARPRETELFVSVISIGMVSHMVEAMDQTDRGSWRRLLSMGRRTLELSGSIINVDAGIVDVWASKLRGVDLIAEDPSSGELFQIGEDDRLVVATAIARDYSIVTKRTTCLDQIVEFTTLTIVEP